MTIVLSKAGPRLINFYRDERELRLLVNGPGMLFQKLELMINRDAVEGASFGCFRQIRDGLRATVSCPHEPVKPAPITLEAHRVGPELSIDLGPTSMYQSQLVIETTTGLSFRELIDQSLGQSPLCGPEPVSAVLVAVRANGHHEHHASASADIRNNEIPDHSGHHSGHGGH